MALWPRCLGAEDTREALPSWEWGWGEGRRKVMRAAFLFGGSWE